jgi:hypothetical protein
MKTGAPASSKLTPVTVSLTLIVGAAAAPSASVAAMLSR